jgi:hypothetical protein
MEFVNKKRKQEFRQTDSQEAEIRVIQGDTRWEENRET